MEAPMVPEIDAPCIFVTTADTEPEIGKIPPAIELTTVTFPAIPTEPDTLWLAGPEPPTVTTEPDTNTVPCTETAGVLTIPTFPDTDWFVGKLLMLTAPETD